MEQTNAFELLGATPSDSIETLQELLDEKELLSDDIAAVQSAYADLTNPKKRLIHEITYFRAEDFAEFKKLVFHEYVESPSIKEVAQIVVNMGLWFDSDNDELFDDINASREESGFVKIEDDATIIKAVDDLQNDCLQVANNYLDNLKENSLVGVFNQIVKIDEYESFFVDELIAHYELIISESLQKKETECRDSFESIEKSCNSFNNGSPLSPYLKTQISVFADKLKSWDNYAQPLQVNMQRHGGQHEASEQLSHLFDQVKIYEQANQCSNSLYAIFYFSQGELEIVEKMLSKTDTKNLLGESVFLIDCRNDNKPSASTV